MMNANNKEQILVNPADLTGLLGRSKNPVITAKYYMDNANPEYGSLETELKNHTYYNIAATMRSNLISNNLSDKSYAEELLITLPRTWKSQNKKIMQAALDNDTPPIPFYEETFSDISEELLGIVEEVYSSQGFVRVKDKIPEVKTSHFVPPYMVMQKGSDVLYTTLDVQGDRIVLHTGYWDSLMNLKSAE